MASRAILSSPGTAEPRVSGKVSNETAITILLFAAGGIISTICAGSLEPIFFALILASPVLLLLWLRRDGNEIELRLFARSLAVGVLAAGIASFFATYLHDQLQFNSDAWSFYTLSSQSGRPRTLEDLRTVTEGAGAVVAWAWFYNFADLLGFQREPYIGVAVNVVMVALSAMIAGRCARLIYGEDDYRIARLVMLFTICGNMYLFAGLHIRDSAIMLVFMVVAYAWIGFLAQVRHNRAVIAVLTSIAATPLLEVLRKEFFFIPLLIGGVALFSLNFSRGRGDARFITLVTMIGGAAMAGVALVAYGSQIQDLLLGGQQSYSDFALSEARSGSLGVSLIVNQPFYIRIPLGLPYLFFFPIPAWVGFQSDSAILFFKSLNVVSFYFIAAYLLHGVLMIVLDRRLRSPAFVFTAALPVVLGITVAATSLESRHLGVAFPILFLPALLPDRRDPAQLRTLRRFQLVIAGLIVFVHLTWAAIRYV